MKKPKKESALSTGVGVPDSSGGRGGARIHKAYQRGGSKYPYDKAAGSAEYGVPLGYDRGSSGNGGSRQNVNVPRDVGPDAERWSDGVAEAHDSNSWNSATPAQGNIVYDPREKSRFGEDDIEEAIGVPYNAAKGGDGGGGATGGRIMPGTSGEWGGRPKGKGWDNHMSYAKLDKAARQDEYGYGPVKSLGGGKNPDDNKIPVVPTHDVELGKGAVILKVGGAGFGTVGKAMKQARMQPGMSWRESVHRGLVEAFVSLKSTEHGCLDDSLPAHEIDKGMNNDAFTAAHDRGRESMDGMKDGDMVMLMMKIDPEYFANSLGKMGKQSLMNTYDEWATEMVSDEKDITGMTERIMKACGV